MIAPRDLFLAFVVITAISGTLCGCTEKAAPLSPAIGGGTVDSKTCEAAGGTCTAVSECSADSGSMGEPSCGAVHMVCCMKSCPKETFSCCAGSATFRPVCSGGQLACREGQTRCN